MMYSFILLDWHTGLSCYRSACVGAHWVDKTCKTVFQSEMKVKCSIENDIVIFIPVFCVFYPCVIIPNKSLLPLRSVTEVLLGLVASQKQKINVGYSFLPYFPLQDKKL